jgi:hypothetical protein
VMQVNKVTATVKYTQDSGKGAWKSVEIGAEATVGPNESWRVAQANLYRDLGHQLKVLWAQNGGGHAQSPQEGHRPVLSVAGGTETQSPTPNWCAEHHTEFKQFSKNGNSWFSHKTADGTWHNRGN